MNSLKAEEEFAGGKHNIGWVSSDFKKYFKDTAFNYTSAAPTFQKLPRAMNDTEIESELKPGTCTLGDVLAFMENPPEGTNDGWWNLFYTPSCVVVVDWSGARWSVRAWERAGSPWFSDGRVFSPATNPSKLCPRCTQELCLSDLQARVEKLEAIVTNHKLNA